MQWNTFRSVLWLKFDHLTAVMGLVVTGIGTLIHLYSIGYMHEDQSQPRFFSYLNLFMFSMLLLVLGGNLLVLFVGWEGVGLCSYLLIGFWFKNIAFAAAGRKAFVVNRIGDAGFLLGIFLLYVNYGSLDFVTLSDAIGTSAAGPRTVCANCWLLICGRHGQIFPDSALCLATRRDGRTDSGISANSRCNNGYCWCVHARPHEFPIYLGAFNHGFNLRRCDAYGGGRGNDRGHQNDIKKVLAYSTVSQLGFMFMAASVGAFWVAIFHVVTHAFFKACLFLGAGSVIHGCHHEQDMRHMGGLGKLMPITAITYGISTLAIAGIFPFAGFESKHRHLSCA